MSLFFSLFSSRSLTYNSSFANSIFPPVVPLGGKKNIFLNLKKPPLILPGVTLCEYQGKVHSSTRVWRSSWGQHPRSYGFSEPLLPAAATTGTYQGAHNPDEEAWVSGKKCLQGQLQGETRGRFLVETWRLYGFTLALVLNQWIISTLSALSGLKFPFQELRDKWRTFLLQTVRWTCQREIILMWAQVRMQTGPENPISWISLVDIIYKEQFFPPNLN